LGLSVRALNILEDNEINSLYDLINTRAIDLEKSRNSGKVAMAEITKVLTDRGLKFKVKSK
jgi:DNA-directed RNA polymerase alpha subunit